MDNQIISAVIGAGATFIGSFIGAIGSVFGAALPIVVNLNAQKEEEKKQKEAFSSNVDTMRDLLEKIRKKSSLSEQDFQLLQEELEAILRDSLPYEEARIWLITRLGQLRENAVETVKRHHERRITRVIEQPEKLREFEASIDTRLDWIYSSLDNGRPLVIKDYCFLPKAIDAYRVAFTYISKQINEAQNRQESNFFKNLLDRFYRQPNYRNQNVNVPLSEAAANVLKHYIEINNEDISTRKNPDT